MILKTNKPKSFPILSLAVWFIGVLVLLTQMSPASLNQEDTTTNVEIEGVNYGAFDVVEGLPEGFENVESLSGQEGGYRIRFKRDFVTAPSLYQWAKTITHHRSELKDIKVTVSGQDGEIFMTYELKQCQPLSWTVEAANPALGGFHESVEVAVQRIEVP